MKTITIKDGTVVSFYESIKEMPVKLHNKAQAYLVQESGIGADMASFDAHFTSVSSFLSGERFEDALNEIQNLRFNFYMMMQGLDFKSMALACYVHSVNGVAVEDRSEEGLKSLIDKLSDAGLAMGDVQEQLEDLKKNFNQN